MKAERLLLLTCVALTLVLPGCGTREPEVVPYEPDDLPRYAYRTPADYTPEDTWPLVVFLHSDGKDEEEPLTMWDQGIFVDPGFILLSIRAPFRTDGAYGWVPATDFSGDADDRLAAAMTAEQQVLDILRDFEEQYSIDREWRFLVGFPGAATAALFTGLRHPEVFQGVAALAGLPDSSVVRSRRFQGIEDVDVFLSLEPDQVAAGIRDSAALDRAGAPAALFRQSGLGVTGEALQEMLRFFGLSDDSITTGP